MVSLANSGGTNRDLLTDPPFVAGSARLCCHLTILRPSRVDGKLVCEEAFTRAALQACLFKPALHPLGARADEVIE